MEKKGGVDSSSFYFLDSYHLSRLHHRHPPRPPFRHQFHPLACLRALPRLPLPPCPLGLEVSDPKLPSNVEAVDYSAPRNGGRRTRFRGEDLFGNHFDPLFRLGSVTPL